LEKNYLQLFDDPQNQSYRDLKFTDSGLAPAYLTLLSEDPQLVTPITIFDSGNQPEVWEFSTGL
jgi:hypothetical protein